MGKKTPTEYKFYDALLFLPPASLKLEKKTRIIEKRGIHIAILYDETKPIEIAFDLPTDFLRLFYNIALNVSDGLPANRVVYFAIVYISQVYALQRAKIIKKNETFKRNFFIYPRWIWLTLEHSTTSSSFFVVNSFDDKEPSTTDKKFDVFGAVGMTYNNYFIFASVARKEYASLINKQIKNKIMGIL